LGLGLGGGILWGLLNKGIEKNENRETGEQRKV